MISIEPHHIKKMLLALVTWLLMSVFISIPAVQLLHKHAEQTDHCTLPKHQNKISSHSKCEICDYLSDVLKKHTHQTFNIETITPAAKLFIHNSVFACAIFKKCISAFTNKGPPIL